MSGTDRHPVDPEWEIAPADLDRLRRAGSPHLLIDCRTPGERALARIDGDRFAPMDGLGDHVEALREAAVGPVIVYCRSGQRSLLVAAALRRAGLPGTRSLAGGIQRWALEIGLAPHPSS